MKALTANRLIDGDVVFWKAGKWVERFADADLFDDAAAAELAEGQAKSQPTVVIDPYLIDLMESDVHAPEKHGILQPVGDTTGPGGLMRALRTIPIYTELALAVKRHCPDAWVVNYTNPMALCVRALYEAFPGVKAFVAMVMGGLSSIPGAVICALLLGLSEGVATTFVSSNWADMVAYGFLIVTLIFFPHGLFGAGRERV